jgi:hypothetical protein
MAIHPEGGLSTKREHVYQFPAAEHQLRSRNSVGEQEQSFEDLRAAIESLQQIVCELLLRNQVLRMALDRERQIVTTSSVTGLRTGESKDSR